MASIARKNLFEDIPRFLVAQAGIMFAVSLVTIQTGILDGFIRSTAVLIDNGEADLWIASEDMVQLELTVQLPLLNLAAVQQVEGVAKAEPLLLRESLWRGPSGRLNSVKLVGFDPEGDLFAPWNVVQGRRGDLNQDYTVIADKASLGSLDFKQLGDVGEIGSLPVRLVGITEGSQSITSSAVLFTSLENASTYLTAGLSGKLACRFEPGGLVCSKDFQQAEEEDPSNNNDEVAPPKTLESSDPISYILVRAKSGEDLQALAERLEATIPDIQVYTQAEMSEITRAYWRDRTGIGFILGLGAVVGVIVGIVIVGQILYSSVSEHLKEFGTLKAMGASNWVIYGVILEQALWMAVLGYFPGIALCYGLGTWTLASQGIAILITPLKAAGVFAITISMCSGAAIFAIQKVTRVDPAIVFKA